MTLYISEAVAVVNSTDGDFKPATTAMPVYTAFTGGTQVTDLTDSVGNPLANNQVTPVAPSYQCIFQSAQTGTLFIQTPDGVRHPVQPSDLASRTGGVSSVNTKSGAVTLTADDIADGTTKVEMLATERTKLTGIATGATANQTDAYLLDRSHHTGTDKAPSTAIPGQVQTVDSNLNIVPMTLPNQDPAPFNIEDAANFANDVPVDGTVAVYSAPLNVWAIIPGMMACYALPAGQTPPAGTPTCVLVDLPAVTLYKVHLFEGTVGATAGAADISVPFNDYQGAARTFTNEQALVGSTSVLITTGTLGYYIDNGLTAAGLGDTMVLKGRVRFKGTPTGSVQFATARPTATTGTGIAALQRDATSGQIKLKDGTGATRATSTSVMAPDTWYIYEWKVTSSGSQTLRWFDSTGAQLEPDIVTTCTTGVIDQVYYGINTLNNGSLFLDKCALAANWIGGAA